MTPSRISAVLLPALLSAAVALHAQAPGTYQVNDRVRGTRQILVTYNAENHRQTMVGLVQSGQLQVGTDHAVSADLTVDLRTLTAVGAYPGINPILESWHRIETAEDPWVHFHLRRSASSTAATTLRIVREPPAQEVQATMNVTGADTPNFLSIERVDDAAIAVEFDYPIHRYGFGKREGQPSDVDTLHVKLEVGFSLAEAIPASPELAAFASAADEAWVRHRRPRPLAYNQEFMLAALTGVLMPDTLAPEATALLRRARVDVAALRAAAQAALDASKDTARNSLTGDVLDPERYATRLAATTGVTYVTTAHILAAIALHPAPLVQAALKSAHLDAAALVAALDRVPHARDMTNDVERLGNPFGPTWAPDSIKNWFSYNVWQIMPYHGRLYFGTGAKRLGYVHLTTRDTAVQRQVSDAYHTRIVSYTPNTQRFTEELKTSDAQLDHYRVANDRLYTPGYYPLSHPGDDWYVGNYYVLQGTSWREVHGLFDAVHCYDVIVYHDTTFAGMGSTGGAAVAITGDEGKTFRYQNLERLNGFGPLTQAWPERIYRFFILRDVLYAVTNRHGVYRYEHGAFQPLSVDLYPNVITLGPMYPSEATLINREVSFGGGLVYVAAVNSYDHTAEPFGLYALRDIAAARPVALPDPAATPYDLLIDGGTLYVLTNIPKAGPNSSAEGGYDVIVYSTMDLMHWRESVRFHEPALARSFARLGGAWYFGLGCLLTQPSPHSGEILRLRQ